MFVGLIGLIGCDRPVDGSSTASAKPFRVVATTTMIGDLVRQIVDDDVEVRVLMPPSVNPHSYKPSPADVARLRRADVVFYNGLHLEGKMVELLEDNLADKSVAVTADMPREKLLAWSEGQTGAYDPHVWFDLPLWSSAAETIARKLGQARPEMAATYHTRSQALAQKLADLDGDLRGRLGQIPPEHRILVTSHDAYNYFGRAYGVQVRGLQGISTETEAGISAMTEAVDFVIARRVPAIFVESSVSPKTIQRVVDDCTARGWPVRIGGELYSDALGAPGEHGGTFEVETYEGMMRYNVATMVEGWGGRTTSEAR